jgi:hypothetical protein
MNEEYDGNAERNTKFNATYIEKDALTLLKKNKVGIFQV